MAYSQNGHSPEQSAHISIEEGPCDNYTQYQLLYSGRYFDPCTVSLRTYHVNIYRIPGTFFLSEELNDINEPDTPIYL
jgi:hypothetical protein